LISTPSLPLLSPAKPPKQPTKILTDLPLTCLLLLVTVASPPTTHPRPQKRTQQVYLRPHNNISEVCNLAIAMVNPGPPPSPTITHPGKPPSVGGGVFVGRCCTSSNNPMLIKNSLYPNSKGLWFGGYCCGWVQAFFCRSPPLP